ncbi:spore coat protein U [Candidatus Rickettsiella viridis]|uniref:Spore coat protein U n=1 Tax=Candidatus Rickettsiella viridis TaxID=676208 RepID=A0A2Z5UUZ1_9COXI|nr:spore coat U domain-containing protein [Candidatus Rickettsiella viridis]BBB14875.1 spore coat protein U [Candidatus Rickettsiella viridis]
MLFRVKILLILFTLFMSQLTWAATATGTLPVSATVIAACLVGTVTPVAFGNYDPTSTTDNIAGQGVIPVTCTNGTSYTIGLNAGTFTGATVTTRRMTGTSAAGLAYGLFQNTGRTTNWGNTPGTDTPAAVVATGTSQSVNVYGKITALQAVAAGSYSDSVTITVNF